MIQPIPKYTDFQLAKMFRAALLTVAGSAIAYKGWSDHLVRAELFDVATYPIKREDMPPVDPTKMTEAELKELGFNKWSSDRDMYLIPLWLVPFLKHGFPVECIDGTKTTYTPENCDNDHRAGLIAYGVNPTLTKV